MLKQVVFLSALLLGVFTSFSAGAQTAAANSTNEIHENVDAVAFQKLVKSGEGIVLDVRTSREFASGHIEGAKNVAYSMFGFEDSLKALDKNATYYVYCRSGSRSGRAVNIMKKQGFKKVYNLSRGVMSWQRQGFPLVR